MEQFRLEQNNTDILIDQINAGDVHTRKKSELLKDEAIKQVLADHKNKKNSMSTIEKLIQII